MMPFLSIIIPIYKVESYLRECLDSIAASSLDCWEAILIDDGSPDTCPQICDEYAAKDRRFRVIHQQNAGVAVARNVGLDVARGEWCWFVDSDDLVDMRPVGNTIEWLKEHKGVDLVMFDLETFKDGETPVGSQFTVDGLPFIDVDVNKNRFLMKHICYHHQRLWYKRELIGEHNLCFTEGVKTGEDGEFMYKYMMLCNYPFKFDDIIYYYRIRSSGSAMSNANTYYQHVKDKIVIFDNLLSFMNEHQIKQEPWIETRLRESMKNMLYAVYKTNQSQSSYIQKVVRDIIRSFSISGYTVFNTFKYRIAFLSMPLYCSVLKINLLIKGLK